MTKSERTKFWMRVHSTLAILHYRMEDGKRYKVYNDADTDFVDVTKEDVAEVIRQIEGDGFGDLGNLDNPVQTMKDCNQIWRRIHGQ